jgi:hypothetical protein
MAIISGSRYEESVVDYFKKDEYGSQLPVVIYSFDKLENAKFFIHYYTTGETLQGLAQRYLRNPALWWTIAEYNPEITDYLNIPINAGLRIPHA